MNRENGKILELMKREKYDFGTSLRKLREFRNISLRQMAKRVCKTAAYISDVECGNSKPPNNELLDRILRELSLINEDEPLRGYFFDLAARQRGEAPDDIVEYLMAHEQLRSVIRSASRKNMGDDFWEKCAREM